MTVSSGASPAVHRDQPGDVLEEKRRRPFLHQQPGQLAVELPARVLQPAALAADRERLAGEACVGRDAHIQNAFFMSKSIDFKNVASASASSCWLCVVCAVCAVLCVWCVVRCAVCAACCVCVPKHRVPGRAPAVRMSKCGTSSAYTAVMSPTSGSPAAFHHNPR